MKTLVQDLAIGLCLAPPLVTMRRFTRRAIWVATILTVFTGGQYYLDGRRLAADRSRRARRRAVTVRRPVLPLGRTTPRRPRHDGCLSARDVRVEIVAVGTELLLGQIADTNSRWLGEELAATGSPPISIRP